MNWVHPAPWPKRRPLLLQPHQKRLQQPLRYPYYVYWGMGSGKTFGGAVCMQHLEDGMKALVVCDKSTVEQWCAELRRIMGCNTSDFRDIAVCVQHYEHMDDPDGAYPRDFDLTIVDEAHRFRNAWGRPSARMLGWMERLRECARLVYMSGTPIVHDATIEMDAFRRMMASETPLRGRVSYYDPRADAKRRHHYADTRDHVVRCPMSWAQCFRYLLNRRQSFTLHLEGEAAPRTRLSSSRNTYNTLLRSICNCPFPEMPELAHASSPKMNRMTEKMRELEECKQVVYSSRKDTGVLGLLSRWQQLATHPKAICCRVDGSMTKEDRAENIARFNRCAHGVLFITDAGAQGIDLKRVDVVHIMEPADNVQEERQIVNRAVRYKAHRARDAVVRVFRYVSTFPDTARVAPPWKRVLHDSGMFRDIPMAGITRKVQYALIRVAREEEGRKTVDERVLEARALREREVDDALAQIRGYDDGATKEEGSGGDSASC